MITDISKLTELQLERYFSLLTFYNPDLAIKMVTSFTTRGKHSYSTFVDKQKRVFNASGAEDDYISSMYETIEIGRTYTTGEIIQQVCAKRHEYKLEPFKMKIKSSCENDFLSLFIVDDVFSEDDSKTLVGYKPISKVRP